jgi:hypothetical protein
MEGECLMKRLLLFVRCYHDHRSKRLLYWHRIGLKPCLNKLQVLILLRSAGELVGQDPSLESVESSIVFDEEVQRITPRHVDRLEVIDLDNTGHAATVWKGLLKEATSAEKKERLVDYKAVGPLMESIYRALSSKSCTVRWEESEKSEDLFARRQKDFRRPARGPSLLLPLLFLSILLPTMVSTKDEAYFPTLLKKLQSDLCEKLPELDDPTIFRSACRSVQDAQKPWMPPRKPVTMQLKTTVTM